MTNTDLSTVILTRLMHADALRASAKATQPKLRAFHLARAEYHYSRLPATQEPTSIRQVLKVLLAWKPNLTIKEIEQLVLDVHEATPHGVRGALHTIMRDGTVVSTKGRPSIYTFGR